jgi:hypothetical protein
MPETDQRSQFIAEYIMMLRPVELCFIGSILFALPYQIKSNSLYRYDVELLDKLAETGGFTYEIISMGDSAYISSLDLDGA